MDIWPIDPWELGNPFCLLASAPIRIWIHLLYNISNISLKTIGLGFRSSFPAPCGPISSKSTSCPKLKLATENDR
jgi:hypothetical protein